MGFSGFEGAAFFSFHCAWSIVSVLNVNSAPSAYAVPLPSAAVFQFKNSKPVLENFTAGRFIFSFSYFVMLSISPVPPFALNESLYSVVLLSSPVIQPVNRDKVKNNVKITWGGKEFVVNFHRFLHLPSDF